MSVIETLSGPGDVRNCQTFLRHLNEIIGDVLGENFLKDIQVDSRRQIVEYAEYKNLEDDFDCDFDLN